jgi:hypothetical protein
MVHYDDDSETDAAWTLSGDDLILNNFIKYPADTFTGKLDDVVIMATHTWEDQKSGHHTETCTFTRHS